MEPGNVWLLLIIVVVTFILSFIGAAVGLVLGHLRLPLLITYLGSPSAGAATNLIVSGCGALAGTVRHARDGRISGLGLALMGIPSCVGAVAAIRIFVRINPLWSYLVIGTVMVISGIQLIRKKPVTPPPGELSWTKRIIVETVIGLGLGAFAAITGLMLGSLRLPMMIRYLRMDPKQAVGTNMAVGCLTGLVGASTAFVTGTAKFEWMVFGLIALPTLIGGYLGGWLTGKLSKEAVQKVAGWIIAVSGGIFLGQAGYFAYRKPTEKITPIIVEETENEWIDYELFDDELDPTPHLNPDPSTNEPEGMERESPS